jgi:hypothetical protein
MLTATRRLGGAGLPGPRLPTGFAQYCANQHGGRIPRGGMNRSESPLWVPPANERLGAVNSPGIEFCCSSQLLLLERAVQVSLN